MTYLPDLHTYLHQSSLLIQAYPTARITTKYSLPRKPTAKQLAKQPQSTPSDLTSTTLPASQPKRDPSATLTLKTYHSASGICLKYRTDKAAEVGRLMSGLGRLARGEVIEMPSAGAAAAVEDKMVVDEPVVPAATAVLTGGGGGTSGVGGGRGGKRRGGKR